MSDPNQEKLLDQVHSALKDGNINKVLYLLIKDQLKNEHPAAELAIKDPESDEVLGKFVRLEERSKLFTLKEWKEINQDSDRVFAKLARRSGGQGHTPS